MHTPPVVSAKEWEAAREKMLVKEKEKALTHACDVLAAGGLAQGLAADAAVRVVELAR